MVGEAGSILMLSIAGKNFNDNIFKYFFYFFPKKRLCHFMLIVPKGDSLHEMSDSVCWEK